MKAPYKHRCRHCNQLEREHHEFEPNMSKARKCGHPGCAADITDGPEYVYCNDHDPVLDLIS